MTEYRFEMYENGEVILQTEVMSLEQARDFFVNNYCKHLALRLFINNEKVPYHLTAKKLSICKSTQCAMFAR